MKRLTSLFVLFLLVGIAPAAWTAAKTEPVKFRLVSYIVKLSASPVGDVKGHAIGFISRRGVAFFENGEVATYSNRLTFDSTKGSGTHQGFSMLTYEDGSTTVQEFRGAHTVAPGEKFFTAKGTGEFIKGTGKFEGIEGRVSYICKQVTPYSKETKSDMYCDVTGTRTLPSS